MTIIWGTKKINNQDYYKAIRRTIIFNADDGTELSGYKAWQKFKKECTLRILPADQLEKYRKFIAHLHVEASDGIAWGVTGLNEITMFINDSRNPFIFRSNMMPLGHELLHWIYQWSVGTFHIKRQQDIWIGGTLKRRGQLDPASTVIIHENWYGDKTTIRFWISWGLGWLPITIPYIPVWKAKRKYNL